MNKHVFTILLVLLLGVVLPTAVSRTILLAQSQPEQEQSDNLVRDGDPIPEGMPIKTSWHPQDDAILSYYHLALFGPDICTSYGDPYSPSNSPWAPGLYTHQFRIRIPADYPHDEVRVELFDPDSMNATDPENPFTIGRTSVAIQNGLTPTFSASCPNSDQKDTCLIDTGELELYEDALLGIDQINPYFFWRVDENRGTGTPPGNGACGQPSDYDPNYNTSTLFELYYFQSVSETVTRTLLSQYTGQTGDGVRDDGAHLTDLYWVSPGAPSSFDKPEDVPADDGSPGSFQVDLTAETSNIIVDPQTGDRYLYLDVTTLSGASENGFDIWAGPPTYTSTVPSYVNARNLVVLNTAGSHSASGVEVTALNYLPLNSNFPIVLDIPLVYVGPEYAGETFEVTMFDSDAGAQPPVTFLFDTIAEGDWSMTFGQDGVPDPDGQIRNCVPGGCNNVWITPSYQITIPGNLENCDYSNPNQVDCTPFYGGWLTARYVGGHGDTYGWEISGPAFVSATAVSLAGPTSGYLNSEYTFTATVSPLSATTPLTYVWAIDNQIMLTQTNGVTDTFAMSWGSEGAYTVSVTAVNSTSIPVSTTHTILIGLDERYIYLPTVFR